MSRSVSANYPICCRPLVSLPQGLANSRLNRRRCIIRPGSQSHSSVQIPASAEFLPRSDAIRLMPWGRSRICACLPGSGRIFSGGHRTSNDRAAIAPPTARDASRLESSPEAFAAQAKMPPPGCFSSENNWRSKTYSHPGRQASGMLSSTLPCGALRSTAASL